MKHLTLIITALVLLLMMSCKSNKATTETTKNTKPMAGDQEKAAYVLKKGACFGRCPIYTLTVYDNGRAEYDGQKFTDKLGLYEKMLNKTQMSMLAETFSSTDFASFESYYDSKLPDLPSVTVGYLVGDTIKTSVGKDDRPAELKKLQYTLENIVNLKDWTLLKSYDEEAEAKREEELKGKIDDSKIVVVHKPGTQVPKWFNKMRANYGLRIVEKVPEQSNAWVVTYDTLKHSAEDVLAGVQADEAVVSAEFYKSK